jgi:MoaA/NifB/PqqE/SkfB family radical SAM enzyme
MSLPRNRYSDLKLWHYPEKVESFRAGRLTPPLCVRLKPTNRCQHACAWCCYSDGSRRPLDRGPDSHLQAYMHECMRERDEIPGDRLLALVADLGAFGVRAIIFSGGGEPLVHPQFPEAVRAAAAAGLQIGCITNGQALSGARALALAGCAAWVRISMDYATPAQFAASRRLSAEHHATLMANVGRFATEAPGVDLGVNFIVTRENAAHLAVAAAAVRDLGVRNVRFSPVWSASFQHYHEPIRHQVAAQIAQARELQTPRFTISSSYDLASPTKQPMRTFPRCYYAQTVPVIGADQAVYACHNTAYSLHGCIGGLAGRSFSAFWRDPDTAAWFHRFNPAHWCRHECANHHKAALCYDLATSLPDPFV